MSNFPITITKDKEIHHFEVGEYPHHDAERCKYRVFENGKFVASFEPDAQQYLHICQNTGSLDEEILYLLADQIENTLQHPNDEHWSELKNNEL